MFKPSIDVNAFAYNSPLMLPNSCMCTYERPQVEKAWYLPYYSIAQQGVAISSWSKSGSSNTFRSSGGVGKKYLPGDARCRYQRDQRLPEQSQRRSERGLEPIRLQRLSVRLVKPDGSCRICRGHRVLSGERRRRSVPGTTTDRDRNGCDRRQ